MTHCLVTGLSHPIPPRPILLHPIPSYPIPSHPITSPIPSQLLTSSHPIQAHPIPSRPIPSGPILSHLIRSHTVSSHPIPSRPSSRTRGREGLPRRKKGRGAAFRVDAVRETSGAYPTPPPPGGFWGVRKGFPISNSRRKVLLPGKHLPGAMRLGAGLVGGPHWWSPVVIVALQLP